MREGWEVKKLDDFCDVEYGTRVVRKRDGGTIFPVYGGGGATFFMDISNREDCLVIARFAMSEKCTRFVKGKFFLNDSGLTVKPKNQNEIIQEFLNLQFFYLNDYIYSLARGTAQKNLDVPKFRKIDIVVPPLPEQIQIVNTLDKAFKQIDQAKANLEKNLHNAKELFQSKLNEVFSQRGEGWEETTLGNICTIKHGFAFKSQYFTMSGEYVLLTPGNFYETGGYRDRGEKQKYYIGDIPQDYILDKNDLLVAMTEQAAGLLGSPILVPEDNKFLHNQRLGLVRPKINILWFNQFFYYLFNTNHVRTELHDSGTGVKVRHTSPTKIGNVNISYPKSLDKQKELVIELDKLHKLSNNLQTHYQQKLNNLEELKKSILQKAFRGELV